MPNYIRPKVTGQMVFFTVNLGRRGNFAKVGAILHGFEFDAIAAWRQNDVLYRDQLGHIVACFQRQIETQEIRRQAFALVFLNGAAHATFFLSRSLWHCPHKAVS